MSTVITEPAVDVCVLGLGVTGGLLSAQLATNGITVAGIEKGPFWDYSTDFVLTKYDEWGVAYMKKYDHPLPLSTITWRNNANQFAIPYRRYSAPGTMAFGHGVGGGAHHWGAQCGRYTPWAYTPYSSTVSKYGLPFLEAIEPNLDLIDFPLTYTEMEPYYVQFEQAFGITGTNQGPFMPMSSNFPMPPHPITPLATMFQTATEALGYNPYPIPTGIASQPYMNQFGVPVNACVYEGWCGSGGQGFGEGTSCYACETGAKANGNNRAVVAALKTSNFTMATNSYVFRLDSNANGQITDCRYYDAQGNVHVQPATAFFIGLWGMNNARIPFLSGVGGTPYNPTTVTGTMGRGSIPPAGGTSASVSGVFNLGANAYPCGNGGGGGISLLDWAADNFDHTGLNFIGGGTLTVGAYYGAEPSNLQIVSKYSAANIGSAYKASVKNYYLPTTTTVSLSDSESNLPVTTHYWDVDPVYTDWYGDPLVRVTADGVDANAYNSNVYISPLLAPILTKMGASNVTKHPAAASLAAAGHTTGQGGSYHHKGGTRAGLSSSTSMLNAYQQSWTTPNLFIAGESTLPFTDNVTAGTHALGPTAFIAAEGIMKYLASPGELATST
jgi:gluconate 2-dehydrogenase alpha chain